MEVLPLQLTSFLARFKKLSKQRGRNVGSFTKAKLPHQGGRTTVAAIGADLGKSKMVEGISLKVEFHV